MAVVPFSGRASNIFWQTGHVRPRRTRDLTVKPIRRCPTLSLIENGDRTELSRRASRSGGNFAGRTARRRVRLACAGFRFAFWSMPLAFQLAEAPNTRGRSMGALAPVTRSPVGRSRNRSSSPTPVLSGLCRGACDPLLVFTPVRLSRRAGALSPCRSTARLWTRLWTSSNHT